MNMYLKDKEETRSRDQDQNLIGLQSKSVLSIAIHSLSTWVSNIKTSKFKYVKMSTVFYKWSLTKQHTYWSTNKHLNVM